MIEYREEMWQKPRRLSGQRYVRPGGLNQHPQENELSFIQPDDCPDDILPAVRPLFSLKQSVLRTSKPGKEDFYAFCKR